MAFHFLEGGAKRKCGETHSQPHIRIGERSASLCYT